MYLFIFLQKNNEMTDHLKLDIVKLEAAASKLRAMAHPMRIAIIELLNNNKNSFVAIRTIRSFSLRYCPVGRPGQGRLGSPNGRPGLARAGQIFYKPTSPGSKL